MKSASLTMASMREQGQNMTPKGSLALAEQKKAIHLFSIWVTIEMAILLQRVNKEKDVWTYYLLEHDTWKVTSIIIFICLDRLSAL